MTIRNVIAAMQGEAEHPNRKNFRGVLATVDQPSDKPPSGARGHRVTLTYRAALEGLNSLLGMGIDYSPTLSRHDTRRKVGIITAAEVINGVIEFAGYFFPRDFPEVILACAGGKNSKIGCSFEMADARVENMRSSVWKIKQATFVGAALLYRDKAAYRSTWIELL